MAHCTYEEALRSGDSFVLRGRDGSEIRGIFSGIRVDRDTLPTGVYAYDIREADDPGEDGEDWLGTIEENYVYANHAGTFLTKSKLTLRKGPNHGRGWANLGSTETDDYSWSFE